MFWIQMILFMFSSQSLKKIIWIQNIKNYRVKFKVCNKILWLICIKPVLHKHKKIIVASHFQFLIINTDVKVLLIAPLIIKKISNWNIIMIIRHWCKIISRWHLDQVYHCGLKNLILSLKFVITMQKKVLTKSLFWNIDNFLFLFFWSVFFLCLFIHAEIITKNQSIFIWEQQQRCV